MSKWKSKAKRRLVPKGSVKDIVVPPGAAELLLNAFPEVDAELRKTWVPWESEDPLWLDLARVAERMIEALGGLPNLDPKDEVRNGFILFIRNLPTHILCNIILHWKEDPNPVRRFIGKGAGIEFATKMQQQVKKSRKDEVIPIPLYRAPLAHGGTVGGAKYVNAFLQLPHHEV